MDQNGEPFHLGKARGHKVLVYFYPKAGRAAIGTRQAYWAGGATLGPILAMAYRAAHAAHAEPIKMPAPAPVS